MNYLELHHRLLKVVHLTDTVGSLAPQYSLRTPRSFYHNNKLIVQPLINFIRRVMASQNGRYNYLSNLLTIFNCLNLCTLTNKVSWHCKHCCLQMTWSRSVRMQFLNYVTYVKGSPLSALMSLDNALI